MQNLPKDEDIARLRLAVARLARRLRQKSEIEMTPSQYSALAALDRDGPMTLGELAALEQIRPPTMTRIVAALGEGGYVQRTPDPSDRRVCNVGLTPAGKKAIKKIRAARSAFLAARFRRLSERDQVDIVAALPAFERLLEEAGR